MRHTKIFVAASCVLLGSCGEPPSSDEQWSSNWQEPTGDVMRALAENSIRGCGEFYQKENIGYSGEYAVACNRMPDGSGQPAWVGYQVWPGISKVEGPDMAAVHMTFGGPPRPDPR